MRREFLYLLPALLPALPLPAQVIFTDSFDTEEITINAEINTRQAGGMLTLQWIQLPQPDTAPSALIDQDKASFNHSYTGSSTSNIDTHSVWTPSADGTTPYNFSSDIAGREWTLAFAASVNASTATDRLRVIVQDNASPSLGDSAATDLAWQLSPGTSTASAQGVKLLFNNTKINWPDADTATNGQTQRLYSATVNEPSSYALTSSVDGTPFPIGAGSLTGLTASPRYLFVHLWDRQVSTTSPANLLASLDSITLSVTPQGPPIHSFSAAPNTIAPGDSTTLTWSITGADTLSISPGVGTVTGSSVSVSPAETTTYTLSASNAAGTTTAQTTVTVQVPIPVINLFTASPPSIIAGNSSTLSWSVTEAISVSISPGIGTVSSSGSTSVSPTSNTTYTLTATNAFGPATASVTVNVTPESQPNFLFIAIDDLKPICGFMAENPGNFLNRIYPDPVKRAQIQQILTPNIDSLAATGIGFHRAYCPVAVCRPSRTALITGYRPKESGITGNADGYFRDTSKPNFLRTVTTLPGHLKNNGYYATGTGKILHTGSDLETDFSGATVNGVFYNSWNTWFPNAPSTGSSGNRVQSPYSPTGIEMNFGHDSGPLEGQGDYATADLIARLLETNSVTHNGRTATISTNQPFFVACGIFRPHLPLYMPKSLLDLFDVNDIAVDQYTLDFFAADLNDISGGGSLTSGDMGDILAHNPPGKLGGIPAWQETIRHYLAACALADRCVGRLLNALAASPHAANTIVVLWSDHGWYLGEKLLFRKTQLWDEAANCVLVIRDPRPGKQAPGGTPCYRPVSLQDLYPTLSSLAGLTTPPHVTGYDISPLLIQPDLPWNIPALTSIGSGTDDAIRIGRWAYHRRITPELYDIANDPDEITNLHNNPAYLDVRNQMQTLLSRTIANDPFPERNHGSYESWRLGNKGWFAAESTDLSPTANPDGDSADNLTEYFFATDPTSADFFGAPATSYENGNLSLRFKIRDLDPSLEYRVRESTGLDFISSAATLWSSNNPAQLEAATLHGAGTGVREVEVSTPADKPKSFFRIEVSED
jgi:arylsulfatase A-like enzyme